MEFSSSFGSKSSSIYSVSPYTYGKRFALRITLWLIVFSWLREEEFLSGRSTRDEYFDSSLMSSKLSALHMMILYLFGTSSTIMIPITQQQGHQMLSCMVVQQHILMTPSLLYHQVCFIIVLLIFSCECMVIESTHTYKLNYFILNYAIKWFFAGTSQNINILTTIEVYKFLSWNVFKCINVLFYSR